MAVAHRLWGSMSPFYCFKPESSVWENCIYGTVQRFVGTWRVQNFNLVQRTSFHSAFLLKQKIHENEILDQLFADLDQNGDLEIDFQEFVTLIAMVTSACHEFFTPSHHN